MAERELIDYVRELASGGRFPWLEVGIGDDAAVVRLPNGDRAVLTTDMLVEGTHFEPGTAAEAAGRKAVARALSDLAAMAARPVCTVAAVSFGTRADADYCRRLCRGMWEASVEFSAPLVGGDVSSGTGVLALTVTALGVPGPGGVVLRSGARPGDAVCVTGALGGSLRGRHLSFTPRLREALDLAERYELHAMIDVSDGLSTDVLHLAEESGVGVTIRSDAVPIHEDALALCGDERQKALDHALNDGEDYELVFCAPPEQARAAEREGSLDTPVTIIGEVTQKGTCDIVLADGSRRRLRSGGWEHLKA